HPGPRDRRPAGIRSGGNAGASATLGWRGRRAPRTPGRYLGHRVHPPGSRQARLGGVIRVVIADDHPVVRAGLRQIVTGQPDMQVAGESADGDGVLAVLAGTPADVLLLDLAMPGAPFPGLLKHVLSRYPGVRV